MFTLKIKLGNEAMQTPADVAEALRDVAGRVGALGESVWPHDYGYGFVKDLNGNKVGEWEIAPAK